MVRPSRGGAGLRVRQPEDRLTDRDRLYEYVFKLYDSVLPIETRVCVFVPVLRHQRPIVEVEGCFVGGAKEVKGWDQNTVLPLAPVAGC